MDVDDRTPHFIEVEVAVPPGDLAAASRVLEASEGVRGVRVLSNTKRLLVDSHLAPHQLIQIALTAAPRAAVTGVGQGGTSSAVALLGWPVGAGEVRGAVRFTQVGPWTLVDGTVDGLTPGPHGLHVHDSGDLSGGCDGLGPHFDPHASDRHGAPSDPATLRHAGDLGNIVADESGRAVFRISDRLVRVSDVIGRCVAISQRADDLGRGASPTSSLDGDSGPVVGCGIIARAAGVAQNAKKICLCDGRTLWDEAVVSANQTSPKLMT